MGCDTEELAQLIETICQLASATGLIKDGNKLHQLSIDLAKRLRSAFGNFYVLTIQFQNSLQPFIQMILDDIFGDQIINLLNDSINKQHNSFSHIYYYCKEHFSIDFIDIIQTLLNSEVDMSIIFQNMTLLNKVCSLLNLLPKDDLIDIDQKIDNPYNLLDQESINLKIPRACANKEPNKRLVLLKISQSLTEYFQKEGSSCEAPADEEACNMDSTDKEACNMDSTDKEACSMDSTEEDNKFDNVLIALKSACNAKKFLQNQMDYPKRVESDFDNTFLLHLLDISNLLEISIPRDFCFSDADTFKTLSMELGKFINEPQI